MLQALGARPQGQRREVRVVPGSPQLRPILGPGDPREVRAAPFGRERLHRLGVLDDLALRVTVKLEEERRQRLIRRASSVAIDGIHLHFVQQFDARHRHAELDRGDDGLHRIGDGGESADRRGHGFRQRLQAQRDLGDDAERAFGTDEETGEVVARRRLAGAAAGLDDPAVGQHHGQAAHVLAHCAVSNRRRTRRAGGRHAAERSVGAGIDEEGQTGVLQVPAELPMGDAGLHGGIEILDADAQDLVHPAQIDRHAAGERQHLSFERRAGAERNHGHVAIRAGANDRADLVGGQRKRDEVGWSRGVVRLAAAVVIADGGRRGDAIAEKVAQRGEKIGAGRAAHGLMLAPAEMLNPFTRASARTA